MRSDIIFNAMERMGYDAMNLSGGDFSFGVEYLEKWSHEISFPLISSNIAAKEGAALPGWLRPYAILSSGDLKIGVLGILPNDSFDAIDKNKRPAGLQITPPGPALKRLLVELSELTDCIFLLSQFDIETTKAIVSQLKGIDFAISHEKRSATPVDQTNSETALAPCGTESSNIETIKLSVSKAGPLFILENEPIVLDDSIPHNPELEALIKNKYLDKLREARYLRNAKKLSAKHKALMDGLALPPHEFFTKINQANGSAQEPIANEDSVDTPAAINE